MKNSRVAGLFSVCMLVLGISSAWAQSGQLADPGDLSLEDLLKADVQTASRKVQHIQDVAAAVYVITRDDIERSGVTSIPEALRMAPGVDVARSASGNWAVSARGFNGRFANKLLVLMDGRSIYSPLFSGVMWEMEDTLMEDIERIEVIRGPGAALWGANAVNGVINIITRHSRDTLGTMVAVGAGTADRGSVAVRHGMKVGNGDLRLWAKSMTYAKSEALDGSTGNDYFRAWRAGFRGDWSLGEGRRLTVSGAASDETLGDRLYFPSVLSPIGVAPTDMKQLGHSANLLARHEWLWPDGSDAALQAYIDRTKVDLIGLIAQQRDTVDLDFQHRPHLGGAHDVVWGLNYRESKDHVTTGGIFNIMPERRDWRLGSAFVQDEITLRPDALKLILGARLEHNNFTGFEPQPNARLIWTPTPQQTWWGAVSKAVRTPSRAEEDAQVDRAVTPANGPMPAVLLRSLPAIDHRLDSERVTAIELGFRQQFTPQLALDVSAFDNRYDRLRAAQLGAASFEFSPVPHAVQDIVVNNGVQAHTTGLEVALDWRVSRMWRVQSAYSTIWINAWSSIPDPITMASASAMEFSAPQHQLSLRSQLTLSNRSQFDVWLRYVSDLPSSNAALPAVAAYTTLDMRYAWQPRPGLELSLVGQNLLHRQHAEIVSDLLPSQALQVPRAVYVKAKWQF